MSEQSENKVEIKSKSGILGEIKEKLQKGMDNLCVRYHWACLLFDTDGFTVPPIRRKRGNLLFTKCMECVVLFNSSVYTFFRRKRNAFRREDDY